MRRWILSLVLALIGWTPGWGAGLIIVDEAHWQGPTPPIYPPPWPPGPGPQPPRPWPRPMPPPRVYAFAPLEVSRHQAEVRITDQIAVTSIEQEFYNPNDRRIEGTFLLPLPKGAQIRKFSMEIDGRQVEAELLAAEKARGIYEDIVRKLKDPALLEYVDRDVFKVRIFPIEARSHKRITLSYTQLLKSDSGLVNYTYPLSPEKFAAKPIPTVSLRVEVQTRRPLKSVYSPSHDVEVRRPDARRATLGYAGKNIAPDTDFQLFFAPEDDEIGVNLMTYKPDDEPGYFILFAAPGLDAKAERVIPKDVVFVLDTSGSMAGKKLDQAKKALLFCVENLNPSDRFEILRFSTETEPIFRALTEVSAQSRRRAAEFIGELKAIGGTAINDALRDALQLRPAQGERPFVVIFLTDGLPTLGVTHEGQIVDNVRKANTGNTRVFCFGIGHDVNTHLLDKITSETRAFSQYVLPDEDLEVKLSSFFTKIKDPVLANPTLKFTGNLRVSKLHPSPLPDLFRGEQLVLVGRYHGHGPAGVVLEGNVNGTPRKFTYDLSFPDRATEHDFIARLWATRRVGYLLDEIRLHGENPELRDETTELARRYAIVTPYTAYLIVEDEARRNLPVTTQSLPELQQNTAARQTAAESYGRVMTERYGAAPVARARSETALKTALAPQAAVSSSAYEAQRGVAGGSTAIPAAPPGPTSRGAVGLPATTGPAPAADYSQMSRYVSGRTFFFNNHQWIDSSIQHLKNPQRVRVTLGSKDYFDLLAKHPNVREWLALGPNIQFALDETIYEIHP